MSKHPLGSSMDTGHKYNPSLYKLNVKSILFLFRELATKSWRYASNDVSWVEVEHRSVHGIQSRRLVRIAKGKELTLFVSMGETLVWIGRGTKALGSMGFLSEI